MIYFFFAFSAFPEYSDCQVIVAPARYDYKPYAYGFQKNSPYLGLFNHYLKEMRERGALKKILNKYESKAQNCPDMSGQPLGMESCFTAFVALCFGMAFGLVLLVLETLNRCCKINTPLFDGYDRKDNIDVDALEPEDWRYILTLKNDSIYNLQMQVRKLRAKVAKLTSQQKARKSWYENF